MNLGEAVYKLIAGRSPRQELDPAGMVARALREAGGVSQLARALGVQRTTVQRWNKGAAPNAESVELLRAVLRRADLRDAREARLRTTDKLVVKGRQDGRTRTVDLGRFLAPGTMGKAVEAYLRGARPADLHIVVWSGITDKHYRWMFQPPGGFAQMAPADRLRATRAAQGGSGGGGSSGAAGGSGGGSGGGGGSYDEDDFDDEPEDDYDEEPDYGDDYLDDLAYEGDQVDGNDGYAFGVSSATA